MPAKAIGINTAESVSSPASEDAIARNPKPLPLVATFILDITHAFTVLPHTKASSEPTIERGTNPNTLSNCRAISRLSAVRGEGRLVTISEATVTRRHIANPVQITV